LIVNPLEWKNYVENLDDSTVQSSSIDFRTGKLYESNGFIPEFLASSKKIKTTNEVKAFQKSKIKLLPGKYYVGVSIEKFKRLPLKWSAMVIPKSSTFGFGGLNVIGGWIDPGFDSFLRYGITVLNPEGVILEKGASLVQVIVLENSFFAETYDGQWKDKRNQF